MNIKSQQQVNLCAILDMLLQITKDGTQVPVMYEHQISRISKFVCYYRYAATNNKPYHPVQGFAMKLPTAGDMLAYMLWRFQTRVQPE